MRGVEMKECEEGKCNIIERHNEDGCWQRFCVVCGKIHPIKVSVSDKSPIIHSLWNDCLYELMLKYKQEGKANVKFSDVDDLVIEKSKRITEYK